MESDLKLWSFLQAFQASPYKYLYMHQMLEALEQVENFSQEDLVLKLQEFIPSYSFWLEKLILTSAQVFENESKFLNPETRFVFYGQKIFPLALRKMSDPPLALSYQGNLSTVSDFTISVVGSREPHELSNEWMQTELYSFLKQHRPSVISGGARGVDQKAHLISSVLDIPTVVVLPSGLAQKYPALWNESHWKNKSIVFVSEMLLSEKISKRNFSSRNRLIAAWGIATLIVEAHRRSGTLITAHHALAEGRAVWIVPGHPQMLSFAGSLELSYDHGQIVRNASDLSSLFASESQPFFK